MQIQAQYDIQTDHCTITLTFPCEVFGVNRLEKAKSLVINLEAFLTGYLNLKLRKANDE